MASKVEYVTYNRDEFWEWGAQYVDGRWSCYTMKMIKRPDPPTPEYLQKKEEQRQRCYEAYKEFGADSDEYKEACVRYRSPRTTD